MKLFIILLVVIIIAAYIMLIFPGRASKAKKADFTGLYFAHRGLHNEKAGAPENTMAAFQAAVEAGYAIELDVRLTADEKVIVFHDADLYRLTGVKGAPESKKYKELKELEIAGTQEHIPLLAQVLDMVGGRVPVMVDILNGPHNQNLCTRSSGIIRAYPGKVCVASFHPGVLAWYRKYSPDVFRGLLTCQMSSYNSSIPKKVAFMKSHMLTNAVSRPQFIAFRIGSQPFPAKLCRLFGALPMGWTCRAPGSEGKNASVLFEGYRPPAKMQ